MTILVKNKYEIGDLVIAMPRPERGWERLIVTQIEYTGEESKWDGYSWCNTRYQVAPKMAVPYDGKPYYTDDETSYKIGTCGYRRQMYKKALTMAEVHEQFPDDPVDDWEIAKYDKTLGRLVQRQIEEHGKDWMDHPVLEIIFEGCAPRQCGENDG